MPVSGQLKKDQAELDELHRSLGYGQEGSRLPPALKAQETALKADQKTPRHPVCARQS